MCGVGKATVMCGAGKATVMCRVGLERQQSCVGLERQQSCVGLERQQSCVGLERQIPMFSYAASAVLNPTRLHFSIVIMSRMQLEPESEKLLKTSTHKSHFSLLCA